MTPSPILKVLFTLTKSGVRSLLMGGQACVLYGAAEFSRDTDIVVLADDENLRRLDAALETLAAERIAVPPFLRRHLEGGHAVHFRCHAPGVEGMRVDVMARLRGLPEFSELWERRTTIDTDDGPIEVLSLPDLAAAKKTQQDKDWPMITRLVEADQARHSDEVTDARIDFWLRQSRTPRLLLDLARSWPAATTSLVAARPLLAHALNGDAAAVAAGLRAEEDAEREDDRAYWAPLRRELEQMRFDRLGRS